MSSTYENNTNLIMDQSDEEACLFGLKLAAGSVLPMVLRSAIELDLFNIIKKSGPNASVSAFELAAQLPSNTTDATAISIDRMLQLLSAHSVLICTLKLRSDSGDGVERRYSLGPVCKFLTKNEDGASLASLSLLNQDKIMMESWYNLKDAVLDGGIAFEKANNTNLYENCAQDERFNDLFNRAMFGLSIIFMNKIIEKYKGFEGLKSLVDVGGGTGATLDMIVSKYPSIKGINFDLHHVIQNAQTYPGVEHIGGDMFVTVPKADAIIMKLICHNWSDTLCQKLLKNCYEALPENGKIILAEYILPENPTDGQGYSGIVDLIMLAQTRGGKERTEKEFEIMAKEAGFHKYNKVYCGFDLWVMEFHK